MSAQRIAASHDAPQIPMRHGSWYMRLLLLMAALVVAAVVYSFYHMAQAPSPTLDLPAGAVEPATPPPPAVPPPPPAQ
jgi:hypothetical protein